MRAPAAHRAYATTRHISPLRIDIAAKQAWRAAALKDRDGTGGGQDRTGGTGTGTGWTDRRVLDRVGPFMGLGIPEQADLPSSLQASILCLDTSMHFQTSCVCMPPCCLPGTGMARMAWRHSLPCYCQHYHAAFTFYHLTAYPTLLPQTLTPSCPFKHDLHSSPLYHVLGMAVHTILHLLLPPTPTWLGTVPPTSLYLSPASTPATATSTCSHHAPAVIFAHPGFVYLTAPFPFPTRM